MSDGETGVALMVRIAAPLRLLMLGPDEIDAQSVGGEKPVEVATIGMVALRPWVPRGDRVTERHDQQWASVSAATSPRVG